MLEELIEKYIAAKAKYAKAIRSTVTDMTKMKAQSDYADAIEELLAFIEKHSDTLIALERKYMLRLSPFDDLG